MSEICEFPLCTDKVERGGFCISHAKYFAGPKVKDKPKPIARESEKRKKDQKVYVKIIQEMVQESDDCEIKSPVCTGKMQGADHIQKRSPKNLLKRKNIKRACNACNQYKENNPQWAKDNGHSISRFKKDI